MRGGEEKSRLRSKQPRGQRDPCISDVAAGKGECDDTECEEAIRPNRRAITVGIAPAAIKVRISASKPFLAVIMVWCWSRKRIL